jgi:hypothetical protein
MPGSRAAWVCGYSRNKVIARVAVDDHAWCRFQVGGVLRVESRDVGNRAHHTAVSGTRQAADAAASEYGRIR